MTPPSRDPFDRTYLFMVWAWGSNTAWTTLPYDMMLGAADVVLVGGCDVGVASRRDDEDRAYLYAWCLRSEVVS